MKSQIKLIILALWLLLAPNQLLAWQVSDASDEQSAVSAETDFNANETDDTTDAAAGKSSQVSSIQPSTPQDDAPPGYLDGAFLWGPAHGQVLESTRPSKIGQPTRKDSLQLTEEQVAKVKTLSEDSKKQLEELIEAMRDDMIDRGRTELTAADEEKAQRWQQERNREALVLKMKIGQAFMHLLSAPQRSEMYRWSILQGGTFALLEPFLREEFDLTDAQVSSLHKIRDENWRKLRTHFLHVSSLHSKDAEPYLAQAYEQLADEQKAQFQKFIATPFVESKADDGERAVDTKQPGEIGMPGSAGGSVGPDGFFYPSGGFGGVAGGNSGNVRQVSSNGLMITWSENNDEVRGFSNSKGDWEILKIAKQERIIPVVGDEVAAVRIGDSMAAFSAAKAQWDVIKLREGSKAFPSVFKGYVTVEDNGHLYTFADAKGQWTSPTDPELQPATKLLTRQRMQSDDDREAFDHWLHTLPSYKGRGIRLTFRGAEVTVHTTRQSWMKETLAAIEAFSRESELSSTESSTLPGSARSIDQIESDISKLRGEFTTLELAVGDGIKKADSTKDGKDDHHRELRELVAKSFDLRQKLQRLEAQRMKLKLKLIETSLDAREKARETIINRRVEELRDGKSQTAEAQRSAQPRSASDYGSPISGTPIGLAGPSRSPIDGPGPAALDSRGLQPSSPDGRIQWPQPKEIIKELRRLSTSVNGFLETQARAKQEIEKWSKPLEQLKSEGIIGSETSEEHRLEMLDTAKRLFEDPTLATLQHDWNHEWSAYQTRLRLLKLDVEEANAETQNLQAMYDVGSKANSKNPGTFLQSELAQSSASVAVAKIKLQRAEELLQLYSDIGTQEPQLNPDSVNAEAPPIADVPAKPVSLTLPKAGETMPMVQREKRAIPGSSETLWVHLGDITGGQVFVEVRDINGKHLLERTSLKSKEFVKFKVNETDVYLQIAEMVNNLFDEDICQVHLSFNKPKLEEKSEESNDPPDTKK